MSDKNVCLIDKIDMGYLEVRDLEERQLKCKVGGRRHKEYDVEIDAVNAEIAKYDAELAASQPEVEALAVVVPEPEPVVSAGANALAEAMACLRKLQAPEQQTAFFEARRDNAVALMEDAAILEAEGYPLLNQQEEAWISLGAFEMIPDIEAARALFDEALSEVKASPEAKVVALIERGTQAQRSKRSVDAFNAAKKGGGKQVPTSGRFDELETLGIASYAYADSGLNVETYTPVVEYIGKKIATSGAYAACNDGSKGSFGRKKALCQEQTRAILIELGVDLNEVDNKRVTAMGRRVHLDIVNFGRRRQDKNLLTLNQLYNPQSQWKGKAKKNKPPRKDGEAMDMESVAGEKGAAMGADLEDFEAEMLQSEAEGDNAEIERLAAEQQ